MARRKLDAPNFALCKRGAVYYVQWWDARICRRVSTRTTDEREAGQFLAQFIAGAAEPATATDTIRGVLAAYLIDRKPRVASFATLEYACAALSRHMADLEPAHITKEQSRIYVKKRRAEGHVTGNPPRKKKTSDGTIIRELVTLRAALRTAGEIAAADRIETPRVPPPRERWLTRPEAARLLDACISPHVRLFLTLALYTGARSGALLALEWRQVDIRGGTINLGSGTGNKRRAVVPIATPLLADLRQAKEAATGPRVIEHGGKPVASVKTGVRAACRRAQIVGVTPHILRHTAATWLAIAGRPLAEVARFLGMSEATAEKVYAKHSPDYLRAAADALAGPQFNPRPVAEETPPKGAK